MGVRGPELGSQLMTNADVVRRFVEVSSNPDASEADFEAITTPELRIHTHPNMVAPQGHVRTAAESLTALRQGRSFVSDQRWEIHDVTEAPNGLVVMRATWSAALAMDAGVMTRGTLLRAEVAAFALVSEGRIARYETYDCYYLPEIPAPP